MKVKDNEIIKGVELAKILGLSPRHISRLAEENVMVKNGQGKYLFIESVQGYVNYIKNQNNAPADLKEEKLKEEIEKIKKDTELKQLRISELRNQLHSASVIEEVMTNSLVALKGKLLSLSNRLAPQLIALDNLGDIQDVIQDNILETLEELSEYDSELFKNKNYVEEEEETENEEKSKNKRVKKSK